MIANRCGVEVAGVGSGMEVDFGEAIGEVFQESEQGGGGHVAGFAQAADLVGAGEVVRGARAEGGEDVTERDAWRGLAEEAGEAEAEGAGDGEREAEDRRMQMQVRVAIPIRRREAEGVEFFKLRADFGGERGGEGWAEEVAQTGLRGRWLEISGGVGERGNLGGASGAEREVQADAEARMAARDAGGFLGVRLVHHEARLREDACGVAAFDGFVDAGAAAKIVAGEDESFVFNHLPALMGTNEEFGRNFPRELLSLAR